MAVGAFIAEAWEDARPGALGFSGATDAVIAQISRPEAMRQRIDPPAQRIFIATTGGAIVGFAATRHEGGAAVELAGIVVDAAHAGRGIGGAILDLAVRTARADHRTYMLVRTETSNTRALGFYERKQFSRTRQLVEDVEGEDVEVWELVREL